MKTGKLICAWVATLSVAGSAVAATQMSYTTSLNAEAHAKCWDPDGGYLPEVNDVKSGGANNQAASILASAHAHYYEEYQYGQPPATVDAYAEVRSGGSAATTDAGASFTSTLGYKAWATGYNPFEYFAAAATSNTSGTLVSPSGNLQFSGGKVRTGYDEDYYGVTWQFDVLDGQSNLLLRLNAATPVGSITITPGQLLSFSLLTTGVTNPAYPGYHEGVYTDITDVVTVQMTPEPAALMMFLLAGGLLARRRQPQV